MAILPIRFYGDPVLTQKAQPIARVTPELRELARNMAETMYASNGIGIAANQVGSLERIIVVDVNWARAEEDEKPEPNPIVMLNPEIVWESEEDDVLEEGCLSIPKILGEVWRPEAIKVRYQTLEGATIEEERDGLHGRCIQHEIDHLNGILFIERMGTIKRKMISRALNQLLKSRQSEPAAGVEQA